MHCSPLLSSVLLAWLVTLMRRIIRFSFHGSPLIDTVFGAFRMPFRHFSTRHFVCFRAVSNFEIATSLAGFGKAIRGMVFCDRLDL